MSSYGDDLYAKDVTASVAVKCESFGVGAKKDDPHKPAQAFTMGTQTANHIVPNAAGTLADLAAASTAIDAVATCLKGLIEELQKTGMVV